MLAQPPDCYRGPFPPPDPRFPIITQAHESAEEAWNRAESTRDLHHRAMTAFADRQAPLQSVHSQRLGLEGPGGGMRAEAPMAMDMASDYHSAAGDSDGWWLRPINPYRGAATPRATQTDRTATSRGADGAGEEGAPEGGQPRRPDIMGSLRSGANGTLAHMGSALIEGGLHLGSAAASSVIHGLGNFLSGAAQDMTTIEPHDIERGDEEEPRPLPQPKAKAQPREPAERRSSYGGSSGSTDRPHRAFVDVGPYQGGTIDVSSGEEAPPARPRRRRRTQAEMVRDEANRVLNTPYHGHSSLGTIHSRTRGGGNG